MSLRPLCQREIWIKSRLHGSMVVHDLEQVVGRSHLVGWIRRRHAIDALHREDAGQARLSVTRQAMQ